MSVHPYGCAYVPSKFTIAILAAVVVFWRFGGHHSDDLHVSCSWGGQYRRPTNNVTDGSRGPHAVSRKFTRDLFWANRAAHMFDCASSDESTVQTNKISFAASLDLRRQATGRHRATARGGVVRGERAGGEHHPRRLQA